MLVRSWSARATREGAESYRRHFEHDLLPRLREVPGHRGAVLLSRDRGPGTELVVLTLWESMDAIRRFAGPDTTTAVVAPEARAVLTDFDREVSIYQLLLDSRG